MSEAAEPISATVWAEEEDRRAAHFQALVESSEDAILSKDAQGMVTSWNSAAERLYGYTPEEAIGKYIGLIIPSDHANEEKEILARALAGEHIAHYETERVRKDGRRVYVSLTVSPIRREGKIVGASVIARDIGERVEREERADRLQEITVALAREANPQRAIRVLVRDGIKALGADAATLGLLDDTGEAVALSDDVGHSREGLAPWQSFPLAADLPMCTAIRELSPVWCDTAEEVCERFPLLQNERFRFAALAVLPLTVEGEAIGAVSFSFSKSRHFGPEEKAFAGSVVQLVSHAFERAKIHEAEQRARRRLSFLARASEVLNEPLDLGRTLERLADLVVMHLSDWCAIDIVQAEERGLESVVIAHKDRSKVELAKEMRRRYPPDPASPSGPLRVIHTGRAELYPEVTEEILLEGGAGPGEVEAMGRLGLVSAMVVPLIARGRTLGALTFAASSKERAFGAEDLELAEDLARRAALAIDTSVLYEREHDTALALQRALLPESLPQVEEVKVATRYLPAEAGLEVGGDWFDVVESSPGSLNVVIGDVAGRGIPAATVMGRLAMAFRALVADGRPIEDAIVGIDRLMKEFDLAQMSTLFAFSLDLSNGKVRYVRAGHPPALLRLPSGEVVELKGECSPPVGLLSDVRFLASETTLLPKSMVLLYTDGLIERRRIDPQREIERLKDVFAAGPQDPDVVVEDVPQELDAERVPDDVALLALRFDGPAL